jgi:hypothetical protein
MTAKVTPQPNVERHEIWPGHAELDRAGVEIAVEMFEELNEETEDDTIGMNDLCCLQDWPRNGRPFRNIVSEYLERARAAGPAAEYAFTAVLTDLAGFAARGECSRDVGWYAEAYGIDGFVLPIHAAVVGVNGAALIMRCTANDDGDGLRVTALAEHSEGGMMALPVNIMLSDSRGEAARLVIGRDGKSQMRH